MEERERDKERSREEKNTIKEIQRQRHRERQEAERQRDGTNTQKTRAGDREGAGDPESALMGRGRRGAGLGEGRLETGWPCGVTRSPGPTPCPRTLLALGCHVGMADEKAEDNLKKTKLPKT